jgi:hypothetical protein
VKFVAIGSKLVYLRIVLGGTAASHTFSGVGGGHFLSRSRISDIKAALRDRTNSAALLSLTLSLAVTLVNALMLVSLAIDISAGRSDTALGVFFRFQVTDFDCLFGFFSLCHFIFLPIYLGCFLVVLCQ